MAKSEIKISGTITQNNNIGNNDIHLDGSIVSTENKKDENNKSLKTMFFNRCSKYFLEGIIIILLGVIVFHHFYEIEGNDVTLILSFVGILATFIVVSNYAQVKEIKDEVEAYKQKMGSEIASENKKLEEKLNSNIKNLEEKIMMENNITRGLAYENIAPKAAILHYLYPLLTSLNLPDTLMASSIINKISRLNMTADLDIINDSLAQKIITDIRSHKNYQIIRHEFEELMNRITSNGEDRTIN
jgi:positive regulator of sigma E activity